MTTNIYLARLLATEREQELLSQARRRRRAREAKPARPSWRERLRHLRDRDDDPRPRVTGDTWITA